MQVEPFSPILYNLPSVPGTASPSFSAFPIRFVSFPAHMVLESASSSHIPYPFSITYLPIFMLSFPAALSISSVYE